MKRAVRMGRVAIATALLVTGGGAAMAWEGFDWNTWQTITGVVQPDVTSPQAGMETLLPLRITEGPGSAPIESVEQWAAKRARILGVLEAFLGEPSDAAVPEPRAELVGEEDLLTYVRRHIRIQSEADDWIPAYLLVPKELPSTPAPAVIVLHQTQAPGKQEAAGMTGDPEMKFAAELVARGYICVVPDAIGFGERIPEGGQPYDGAHDFYRKHPQWSFFGKMIWDVQRIVDYLETVPEIDATRIGSIGHSHGAYGTIMCMLFEPRIAAGVASCGFTTLRSDPDPERWSHLTALLPRLGYYVDDIKAAPFDWHEVLACLAPRPFFNWATLEDDIFPNTANLAEVYAQVRSVYALYGNEDLFEGRLGPGAHRFPQEQREAAYAWLDTQLGSTGDE